MTTNREPIATQLNPIDKLIQEKSASIGEVIPRNFIENSKLVLEYLDVSAQIYKFGDNAPAELHKKSQDILSNYCEKLNSTPNFAKDMERSLKLAELVGLVDEEQAVFFTHSLGFHIKDSNNPKLIFQNPNTDNLLALQESTNPTINKIGELLIEKQFSPSNPILELSYDLLASSLKYPDSNIFDKSLSLVIDIISNRKPDDLFLSLSNKFLKEYEKNKVEPTDLAVKYKEIFVGLTYAIVHATTNADTVTQKKAESTLTKLGKIHNRAERQFKKYGITETNIEDFTTLTTPNLENLLSIKLPKDKYIRLFTSLAKENDPIIILKKFTNSVEFNSSNNISQLTNLQLIALGFNNRDLTTAELKANEENYKEVISKIFKNNKWMVADSGDRFSADKENITDSDQLQGSIRLKSLGINSLCFKPTTTEEREKCNIDFGYNIEINLGKLYPENSDKLNLILSDDGKIFDQNGQQVVVPEWALAKIKKVIVQRLQYITDGKGELENQSSTPDNSQEKSDPNIVRRAHFRKIHGKLDSPGALEHAREVLEDPRYGIDIIKRNLDNHIANPDLDHLDNETFVRATIGLRTAPYEHTYNPSLKATN